MALLTIGELSQGLGDKAPTTDQQAGDMIAGVTNLIARLTNRTFAMRVSHARTNGSGGSKLELTVPGHRSAPGGKVSLRSDVSPSPLNGIFPVESTTRHQIVIDLGEASVTDAELNTQSLLVREVQREIQLCGRTGSIFVSSLPLAEVISVSYSDGAGNWLPIDEGRYEMAAGKGGLSFSGEIALRCRPFWSCGRPSLSEPARVEYVAGEPYVLWDLVSAALNVLVESQRQGVKSGLQSERFDYYSYSRVGPDELRKLLGSAANAIEAMKLPVM